MLQLGRMQEDDRRSTGAGSSTGRTYCAEGKCVNMHHNFAKRVWRCFGTRRTGTKDMLRASKGLPPRASLTPDESCVHASSSPFSRGKARRAEFPLVTSQ